MDISGSVDLMTTFNEDMVGRRVRVDFVIGEYDPTDDSVRIENSGGRWVFGKDVTLVEAFDRPEPGPGAVVEVRGVRYLRIDSTDHACWTGVIWDEGHEFSWSELNAKGAPTVLLAAPEEA